MPPNRDTPDTARDEVTALQSVWSDARDVMGGTRALLANVEKYLPKHPKERDADYSRRAKRAVLYNAYARTIKGSVGLIFARPCQLGDDVPRDLRTHWEDLDGLGTHGDVWLRGLATDGAATGTAGFLVEYPATDGPVTLADQQARNLRPYWVPVKAEDIVTWDLGTTSTGRTTLTMLALRESVDRRVGRFGIEKVKRIRVYYHDPATGLVSAEVWEEMTTEQGKEFAVVAEYPIVGPSRIPFVPLLLGAPTSFLTAAPPLLDLLDLNVTHFQVKAGRLHLMHLCCVPIPVRKGYVAPLSQDGAAPAPRIGLAPNVLQDLPPEGDFFWREPAGTAFAPTAEELRELEKQMAAIGLAFLAAETRQAETAEAKRIDSLAQNATLIALAGTIDDAVEQGLALHAEYLGLARTAPAGVPSGGSFSTNRDFERTVLDPGTLKTLSEMQGAGQLTLDTLWALMEQGGSLPDGFDARKERAELERARDEETVAASAMATALAAAVPPRPGTPAAADDDEFSDEEDDA
jgi:hypothetical protein